MYEGGTKDVFSWPLRTAAAEGQLPFPKEGEFRPHRHSHADAGKAAHTRVPALLLYKI